MGLTPSPRLAKAKQLRFQKPGAALFSGPLLDCGLIAVSQSKTEITTLNPRKRIAPAEFFQITSFAGALNIGARIRGSRFEGNDASCIHIFAVFVRGRVSALLGWIKTIVYWQPA